ncbi:glycosyltransferase family 4 protein [Corynebacterium suicordis]|uniref:Glycosyltransferase family 1 protein n=1 Tax=Corynebacterium suicordis DSM 45110 TaxID=1121369 RepID=A0ABR9ZJM1_9CORY|nr:glycosyltransferase family 1 protein [Corynebacterium suicordis]MBF4552822.1 glycosyltransferase family 1 protein [Corynebacterium suicordis DSM 45110]MDR6278219.1 phosphatidylinositol alpha 1,6-mannosyltransferase [Corynebacterium suicordis]
MRVAIVAESFLPNVNGVVNSVLRVLEYLRREGHEAVVIAPGARDRQEEIFTYEGFRIVRVPTVEVPGINSLPIGVPLPTVLTELSRFRPDVVHLASPFVLGAAGAFAAKTLNVPCVAIYQTDVAGFANNYKFKALAAAVWQWTRAFHNQCAMTLAPSSVSISELEEHGVRNIHHWGRGVDTQRFHPSRRSEKLREDWLREGQRLRREIGQDSQTPIMERRVVGFVGRLAAEKSVERMAALNSRDDVQLVIVGDGPELEPLKEIMPTAVFTGGMYGDDLPRAFASLDVFVHTGQFETFCQAVQEAHASGVPAIAPAAGGPVDLINPGVNGYLLEVNTFEQDLPGAIDDILAVGLATMKAQAFNTVQGKSWNGLCEQLMGYYLAAMEKNAPRGFGAVIRVAKPAQRELTIGHSQRAPRDHSQRVGSQRANSPREASQPAAAPAAANTAPNQAGSVSPTRSMSGAGSNSAVA